MPLRPRTAVCAWAGVILLVAGCSWAPRPYARDPLLRDGRGLRADPATAAEPAPPPDPQPPLPPEPSTAY